MLRWRLELATCVIRDDPARFFLSHSVMLFWGPLVPLWGEVWVRRSGRRFRRFALPRLGYSRAAHQYEILSATLRESLHGRPHKAVRT